MTASHIITSRNCARCGRRIQWDGHEWRNDVGQVLEISYCAIDPHGLLLCSAACKKDYCEFHPFEQAKLPEDQPKSVTTQRCPVCHRWMYHYAEGFWRDATGARLAVSLCELEEGAVMWLCSDACKGRHCAAHPGRR